ncbi:MAG TPA: GNAT family N-acetyltransferase [Euzebya sp.]|nr:GNAT family N-acetyltransferase [Euzebya sp.]
MTGWRRWSAGADVVVATPQRPAARIRPAGTDEAHVIADIHLASRKALGPAIPAPVHSDAETRQHFADHVVATHTVWVVEDPTAGIVAFIAVIDGWIAHLYVDPGSTGRGHGTVLLDLAKAMADQLDLWTFQANEGAWRFYARHGFVEVDRSDGDNEEGAPDVHLRWTRYPGRQLPRRGARGTTHA